MTRPKPLLQDRPIDKKKRQRQQDAAEMLVSIVDDLCIVCAILTETDTTIDDYALQRVYASREWKGIADICPDAPAFEDMRHTDWAKLEQNVKNKKADIHEGVNTQLIPFDREHLTEHIDIALQYLKTCYNTRRYENSEVYEMIKEIYDSQAFCQVTQPLLSNPQLANAYKRQLQASRKHRKGTRLPERL